MKNYVLFISGLPESGKSELGFIIAKSLRSPLISTDCIIDSQIFPKLKNKNEFFHTGSPSNPEISDHYSISKLVKSSVFCVNNFFKILLSKITNLLETYLTGIVVVEGYLGENKDKCVNLFPRDKYEVLELVFTSKNIINFTGENFDLSDFKYDRLLAKVNAYLQQHIKTNLTNSTLYQKFDQSGSSESELKYNFSRLTEIIKPSDRILDVGCNSGYFCFRMSELTTGDIIGIDFDSNFISQAKLFNSLVYKSTNCKFFCLNILENQHLYILANGDLFVHFDLVICFSTFHYFGVKQEQFLSYINKILSNNGLFLIEVELSTSEDKKIVKIKRNMDDSPCYFPSLEKFHCMISGLFEIISVRDSVFQRGSCFERKSFLLKKQKTKGNN